MVFGDGSQAVAFLWVFYGFLPAQGVSLSKQCHGTNGSVGLGGKTQEDFRWPLLAIATLDPPFRSG